MTFNPTQLENMADWCAVCPELAEAREDAWRTFFGENDPRPVRYWEGAGAFTSKQRRFLGWFMFGFSLEDGRRPAEVAAEKLYAGPVQAAALQAARGARYVMAIVRSVLPGQSLWLELGDERLEVSSRLLNRLLTADSTLVSYLVPSRPGLWIPGPGWLEWPFRIGPNMRQSLKKLQLDPISMERLLRTRSDEPDQATRVEYPRDATLEHAVERMAEAARAEGRPGLVMSVEEWRELVLKHLDNPDFCAFTQEIVDRAGEVNGVEEINRWLALAVNIWNATPQPDRGGRTAYKMMSRENLDL